MYLLDILVLSCFIGYFAIWHVTPVLHSPLMSVTNAVSGIVIVGAFQALRDIVHPAEPYILFLAVFLASVNIFGGFYVSARMLNMFKPDGQSGNGCSRNYRLMGAGNKISDSCLFRFRIGSNNGNHRRP